jgi:hypothetical protein
MRAATRETLIVGLVETMGEATAIPYIFTNVLEMFVRSVKIWYVTIKGFITAIFRMIVRTMGISTKLLWADIHHALSSMLPASLFASSLMGDTSFPCTLGDDQKMAQRFLSPSETRAAEHAPTELSPPRPS